MTQVNYFDLNMTSNTQETQSSDHLSTNRVRIQLDNITEFERTTNHTPEGRTITYKYSLTEIERIINHKPHTRRKRLKGIYAFPLETHELSHRCYASFRRHTDLN